MQPINNRLQQMILELRKETGLSLVKLSQYLDVSFWTLQSWEQGKAKITSTPNLLRMRSNVCRLGPKAQLIWNKFDHAMSEQLQSQIHQ